MNRLRRTLRLSHRQWAVLLEAFISLLWARWQLTRLPLRQLAPRLGALGMESPWEGEAWQALLVREVRWVIPAVARRLPGLWSCLVMAVAARHMLARRGLPCTLYLGVSRAEGGLTAHAWLRCGNLYVTGAEARARFTIVASFGHVPPGSRTPSSAASFPGTRSGRTGQGPATQATF